MRLNINMNVPIKTAEYEHLDELPPILGAVYGPFTSRLLGPVLGINFFNETKVCSFDCPYCELGRTTIRMNQLKRDLPFSLPEQLISEIRNKLKGFSQSSFNKLLISGNGEPTLYPHLSEIIDLLIAARNEYFGKLPIALMTNGVHLDSRRTLECLDKLDEVMVKLDAGNETVFKLVNNPIVRAHLPKVISGTRKLRSFTIQSFFVRGIIDNTKDAMIDEWIEVIGMMKPEKIYLYTLKHTPPIKGLLRADEDTLYTIASKLKRRTQIEALVFP